MSIESSIEIEETAAEWLAKRDVGGWTDADQVEFDRWLKASTANRVAFVRLEAAWQQAHRLNALGTGALSGVVPPQGEWKLSPFFDQRQTAPETPQPPTRTLFASARFRVLAASIVLAAVFSVGWYLWPHGSSYRTEIGGIAAVPMSDGSKVTLNTDSEIRVAVTETERRVNLEQGEAFFEVAKDPTRPFVVSAGDQRVIAVGTKFSVRREEDHVRVVVTEGRVRVEGSGRGASVPVAQLSAGAVARAGADGTLVQEKPLPEAEEYLSWRSGYLIFHETALADAVAEFNRYSTRKIVIEDPAIAVIHVGGNFRSTNVEGFVRLLEQGFPIQAERRSDQIVLRTR